MNDNQFITKENAINAFLEEVTGRYLQDFLETYIDRRKRESVNHIKRTMGLTGILVKNLIKNSKYSDELICEKYEALINAAGLHDIGKIGIDDTLLFKPDKVTISEFEIIKQHVSIGKDLLEKALKSLDQNSAYVRHCYDIVLYHHERWDGKGYLKGLKGEEIPLSARIVSVVDVYDALTSERCYKQAYSHDEAVKIIIEGRGSQFDPYIVDCFYETAEDFCSFVC